MLDVLGGELVGNTAAAEIHHLDPDNLAGGDLGHRRDRRVPPVVERNLLFTRLLLDVDWDDQSRTVLSHGSVRTKSDKVLIKRRVFIIAMEMGVQISFSDGQP